MLHLLVHGYLYSGKFHISNVPLRVYMNEEMGLSSSLIIWFEGSSSGPSHSHFLFNQ